MQTKNRARINLRGSGDLIAAVPHLLGFKPTESVVICVYAGPAQSRITLCLRADIPPPELYSSLADQLKLPILRTNSCGVSVIVVSDRIVEPQDPLPHRQLVDTLAHAFGMSGVAVHHAYWVPAIEKNATWWCYSKLACTGRVPDPDATELAATAACLGSVTYDSRADIRATLEPPDRSSLGERADRIEAALRLPQDEVAAHRLLEDLVSEVRAGTWTLKEDEVVDLAVALENVRVRDECLRPEVTSIGLPIEEAWSALTRAFPEPYRAEPACLLALTAFLRGDGVLAGVAVEIALKANPDHSFAGLLRTSMDYGLPPDSVASAVARAFSGSEELPELHPPLTSPPTPPLPPPPPNPHSHSSLEIHTTEASEPHPPQPSAPPTSRRPLQPPESSPPNRC